MKRTGYIYGLVDLRNGELRYIGKTFDPAERLRRHRRENGDTYKCNWVKSIGRDNVGMTILLAAPGEMLCDIERRLIAHFRERHYRLTNTRPGGDGGGTPGLPKTDAHRIAQSLAAKRRHSLMSPEQRSEIARRGRASLSPEQRSEIGKRAAATRNARMTWDQQSERAKKAAQTRSRNRLIAMGQEALPVVE